MARNKVFTSILSNLGGFAFPLLVGLFCIPIIVDTLGVLRFGFLTLAWVLIGYFSVFDLGLGRALTQAISSKLGADKKEEIYPLTRKVLVAMAALSLFGMAVLASTVPLLLEYVIKMPPEFQSEAQIALLIIAVGIPAVVMYSGFKGILEAFGYFHYSALSRATLGVWTFVSPLVVFVWNSSLIWIIAALVAGRFLIAVFMAIVSYRIYARGGYFESQSKANLKEVLAFGGWMTVSNLISPIMVFMDRFFVSSIIGVATVAYYTTPYDLISRLAFIPEAVFSVLFPMMARHHASGSDAATGIYRMSMKALALVMALVAIFIICISPLFLTLWLNEEFAARSYLIMDILVVGLVINVMARPAYNLIQARGRPDITAKLHLIELPIYVPLLLAGIYSFGITGAAWAWLGRAFMDFVLLTFVVHGKDRSGAIRIILSVAALGFILCGLAYMEPVGIRILASTLTVLIIGIIYKIFIISPDEIAVFKKLFTRPNRDNPPTK